MGVIHLFMTTSSQALACLHQSARTKEKDYSYHDTKCVLLSELRVLLGVDRMRFAHLGVVARSAVTQVLLKDLSFLRQIVL